MIQRSIPDIFSNIKDPVYTVGWLMENQIFHVKDSIVEIALKASKEAELIKMID